jgi:hypothetical protein
MSRIPRYPLSNLLRDRNRKRKPTAIQPETRADLSARPELPTRAPVGWLVAPTFEDKDSADSGDPANLIRPADAIRNQEQKKKLTLERDLHKKVAAEVVAALAAAKEPAIPVLPADKIPFTGDGPALARHIIGEYRKAFKAGKIKTKYSDSTLIKKEVPRYCKKDGTPFDYENVRTSYLRSRGGPIGR